MMILPIRAFCLNGNNGDKISLTIDELIGFPDEMSFQGGYEALGTLEIQAGGYRVFSREYSFATGIVYYFGKKLKECYSKLEGEAVYETAYGTELLFKVQMDYVGHALITGTYRELPDVNNILEFEITTDQSYFADTIKDIEQLEQTLNNEVTDDTRKHTND